jgi:hypothetical protein
VSERIQLPSLPGLRENYDLSWRGPIVMAKRKATVSERIEPKLAPKKVSSTTKCKTSMNRA